MSTTNLPKTRGDSFSKRRLNMRRRLSDQSGIALPVAMMVLLLVLVMSGVVVTQAQRTNDGARQDRKVKRALQAADAGVKVAFQRATKITAPGATPCVAVDANGGGTAFATYENVGGESWCPAVEESLGGGARYSYRVSGPLADGSRWVVSTGTADAVARRVAVQQTAAAAPLYGGYAISAKDEIALSGETSIRHETAGQAANARANLAIRPSGTAKICGNATPGPGQNPVKPEFVCPGYSTAPATSTFTLPDVALGTSPTVNDNATICAQAGDCTGDFAYDASGRKLTLTSGKVTLRGGVYFLCEITQSGGSQIVIAPSDPTTPVRLFIGGPAYCSSGGKISLSGSSIVGLGSPQPILDIRFQGSPTTSSSFTLTGASKITLPTGVYGPYTNYSSSSSSGQLGAIAVNKVSFSGGTGDVTYPSVIDGIKGGGTGALSSGQYRECSSAPPAGAAPAARC